MTKPLFVEWCAKDVLDGTLQMDPLSELAYRRIIDMIYASDDQLRDDDDMLQYATKTGAKWKAIKKKLIDVYKKISAENGFIRQARCTEKLVKTREIIAQNSAAGIASAKARKALKDKEAGSTGVEIPLPETSTESQPTTNPITKVSKEDKPLTPFSPPDPTPDTPDPDGPVSFSQNAKRSTPWYTGKVISWTAGEYQDAIDNHEVTVAQIDAYLKKRDNWYTGQPERVQLGWQLATIRDFAQQYGRRRR